MVCPKCGGEMRPGEATITDITPLGRGSIDGIMSIPGSTLPDGSGGIRDAEMTWREKTGKKTGWLFNRDEQKVFQVTGLRCTECGYIELYAK